MPDFFIILIVAIWILSAVNSIRKAMAKSQAQARAQLQAQPAAPAAGNAGVMRLPPSQRGQALQQAIRVIRAIPVQPSAPPTFAEATAASQAAAPQISMTDMVAPSMPAFDALTLATDQMASTASPSDASPLFTAGRLSGLTEDRSGAALAMIAAAVIGPPVGLRSGALFAADW